MLAGPLEPAVALWDNLVSRHRNGWHKQMPANVILSEAKHLIRFGALLRMGFFAALKMTAALMGRLLS